MEAIPLNYEDSKAATYKKMQYAIAKAAGELIGDENKGSFDIPVAVGRIIGYYEMKDSEVVVEIKKKPFLVSMKMIQEKLQEFLNA